MNTKYIILLVIIFILIILLKKSEENIENMAPSNTDLDVVEIRIKENMDKYLEFQKI